MPDISTSSANNIKMPSIKKLGALLASLILPPLGLILAVWLILKARKLQNSNYTKWALYLLVAAVAGSAGYVAVAQKYDKQEERAYSTESSQSDITVCLDGKQTIIITQDSPYSFDIGDSDVSGRISPTMARLFINNTNGDFEVGVGKDKGKHHFDEGECPGG